MTREAAKAFEASILELAGYLGYRRAHFRPALTKHGWRTPVSADGKGFPDLLLVHPERGFLFAELKTGAGRLEPEQIAWRDTIVLAGGRWYLWTDRCRIEDIAAELRDPIGTHTPPHGRWPHVDPQLTIEEAS